MIALVFFIFLGFFIDYINNLAIKFTINKFLSKKNRGILYLSLLIRIIFLLTLFIIIVKINVKYLYYTFIGLVLSKLFLLITKKLLKNEHNN